MLQVSYTLTEDELRAALHSFNSRLSSFARIASLLIGPAILPSALLLTSGVWLVLTVCWTMLAVALIFYAWVVVTSVSSELHSNYAAFFFHLRPTTVTLEDRCLKVERSGTAITRYPWKAIETVIKGKSLLFINVGDDLRCIISKRAFRSDQAWQEFTTEIESRQQVDDSVPSRLCSDATASFNGPTVTLSNSDMKESDAQDDPGRTGIHIALSILGILSLWHSSSELNADASAAHYSGFVGFVLVYWVTFARCLVWRRQRESNRESKAVDYEIGLTSEGWMTVSDDEIYLKPWHYIDRVELEDDLIAFYGIEDAEGEFEIRHLPVSLFPDLRAAQSFIDQATAHIEPLSDKGVE